MTHYPGWGSWSFQPVVIIALVAAAVAYSRVYRRAPCALVDLGAERRALGALRGWPAHDRGGAAVAA